MTYIWKHKKWPNFKWQTDKLINALNRARLLQGQLLSKLHSLGLDLSKEQLVIDKILSHKGLLQTHSHSPPQEAPSAKELIRVACYD